MFASSHFALLISSFLQNGTARHYDDEDLPRRSDDDNDNVAAERQRRRMSGVAEVVVGGDAERVRGCSYGLMDRSNTMEMCADSSDDDDDGSSLPSDSDVFTPSSFVPVVGAAAGDRHHCCHRCAGSAHSQLPNTHCSGGATYTARERASTTCETAVATTTTDAAMVAVCHPHHNHNHQLIYCPPPPLRALPFPSCVRVGGGAMLSHHQQCGRGDGDATLTAMASRQHLDGCVAPSSFIVASSAASTVSISSAVAGGGGGRVVGQHGLNMASAGPSSVGGGLAAAITPYSNEFISNQHQLYDQQHHHRGVAGSALQEGSHFYNNSDNTINNSIDTIHRSAAAATGRRVEVYTVLLSALRNPWNDRLVATANRTLAVRRTFSFATGRVVVAAAAATTATPTAAADGASFFASSYNSNGGGNTCHVVGSNSNNNNSINDINSSFGGPTMMMSSSNNNHRTNSFGAKTPSVSSLASSWAAPSGSGVPFGGVGVGGPSSPSPFGTSPSPGGAAAGVLGGGNPFGSSPCSAFPPRHSFPAPPLPPPPQQQQHPQGGGVRAGSGMARPSSSSCSQSASSISMNTNNNNHLITSLEEIRRIVPPRYLCLYACAPPPVALADYAHQLMLHLRCGMECFVMALSLVERAVTTDVSSYLVTAPSPASAFPSPAAARFSLSVSSSVSPVVSPTPSFPPPPPVQFSACSSEPPTTPTSPTATALSLPPPPPPPPPPSAVHLPLCPLSHHRLLLAAAVVCAKSRDDWYLGMSYYAEVGGVSPDDLRQMEVALLEVLGFSSHVSTSAYVSMLCSLQRHTEMLPRSSPLHGKAKWNTILGLLPLPMLEQLRGEVLTEGTMALAEAVRRYHQHQRRRAEMQQKQQREREREAAEEANALRRKKRRAQRLQRRREKEEKERGKDANGRSSQSPHCCRCGEAAVPCPLAAVAPLRFLAATASYSSVCAGGDVAVSRITAGVGGVVGSGDIAICTAAAADGSDSLHDGRHDGGVDADAGGRCVATAPASHCSRYEGGGRGGGAGMPFLTPSHSYGTMADDEASSIAGGATTATASASAVAATCPSVVMLGSGGGSPRQHLVMNSSTHHHHHHHHHHAHSNTNPSGCVGGGLQTANTTAVNTPRSTVGRGGGTKSSSSSRAVHGRGGGGGGGCGGAAAITTAAGSIDADATAATARAGGVRASAAAAAVVSAGTRLVYWDPSAPALTTPCGRAHGAVAGGVMPPPPLPSANCGIISPCEVEGGDDDDHEDEDTRCMRLRLALLGEGVVTAVTVGGEGLGQFVPPSSPPPSPSSFALSHGQAAVAMPHIKMGSGWMGDGGRV